MKKVLSCRLKKPKNGKTLTEKEDFLWKISGTLTEKPMVFTLTQCISTDLMSLTKIVDFMKPFISTAASNSVSEEKISVLDTGFTLQFCL